MANYKIVNADQLDNQIKATADAIRAKTGGAELLLWKEETGFADAVSAISGGGGSGSCEDVRYVIFMDDTGTVEYGRKAVAVGDDCADPIARGIFDTPTKESTAQYDYTFSGGWATTPDGGIDSNALKTVTADRILYANFISAVRYYTVTYYDSDGVTVLKTERLAYGVTPSYAPKKDGFVLAGWNPEFSTVTGDASYTAFWSETITFAGGTWNDIARISESGEAERHFSLGDEKIIPIHVNYIKKTGSYTYETIDYTVEVPFVIVHFGDHECEDGSIAGITLLSKYALSDEIIGNTYYHFNTTIKMIGLTNGWDNSTARQGCNEIIPEYLPEDLTPHIKPVKKLSHGIKAGTGADPTETLDTTWIPSLTEYGLSYVYTNAKQGFKFDGINYVGTTAYGMSRSGVTESCIRHGTRSACTAGGSNFCVRIDEYGRVDYEGINYYRIGFCI